MRYCEYSDSALLAKIGELAGETEGDLPVVVLGEGAVLERLRALPRVRVLYHARSPEELFGSDLLRRAKVLVGIDNKESDDWDWFFTYAMVRYDELMICVLRGGSGAVRSSTPLGGSRRTSADAITAPSNTGCGSDGRKLALVCGGKGGIGKTFIATNLAAACAGQRGDRVCLLDLSLPVGDVGLYLDLCGEAGLERFITTPDFLSSDSLMETLVSHRTGMKVLLGNDRPELVEIIRPEQLIRVVDLARQAFEVTVVDTGPDVSSPFLYECMEMANVVLVVTTPELGCLRRTQLMLDLVDRLQIYRPEKVGVVVNRWTKESPISASKVGALLGVKPWAVLPDDQELARQFAARGRLACEADGSGELSRAIKLIAQRLVGPIAESEVKRTDWLQQLRALWERVR